ncbi:MAG: hypothetical protein E6899_10160, partial [Neisseria sp.]|nr:hypothetical protein [Neisseria sp.]
MWSERAIQIPPLDAGIFLPVCFVQAGFRTVLSKWEYLSFGWSAGGNFVMISVVGRILKQQVV